MTGRPRSEAASPSALPPALVRFATRDTAWVAAAGGFEPDVAERDTVPVTPSRLRAMLDAACEIEADPHLALRLPRELRYRRYDALTLAARAASSRREVFELVVRYAPLVFPALVATVTTEGHALRLSLRIDGHPRGLGLAVDELLVATVLALATRDAPARAARAWLTASRPASLEPLFAALGTDDVDLGAPDAGLVVDDAPLAGDPLLLATATELADKSVAEAPRPRALADAVGAKIDAALRASEGLPSMDSLAAALHMSSRTLGRRLDEQGMTLSAIVDARRAEAAKAWLDDASLTLADIAFRTGFSDLATFSRAFKRWTGMPPGAFRKRHGTKQ